MHSQASGNRLAPDGFDRMVSRAKGDSCETSSCTPIRAGFGEVSPLRSNLKSLERTPQQYKASPRHEWLSGRLDEKPQLNERFLNLSLAEPAQTTVRCEPTNLFTMGRSVSECMEQKPSTRSRMPSRSKAISISPRSTSLHQYFKGHIPEGTSLHRTWQALRTISYSHHVTSFIITQAKIRGCFRVFSHGTHSKTSERAHRWQTRRSWCPGRMAFSN
jgi:hypothetical protein